MEIDVVHTAEAVTAEQVRGAAVLVVDVLRASTSIVTALTHGCAAIVPVADQEEARRRARAHGMGALLGGERRGETIAGFDVGNSPVEFASRRVRGATIFLTTSNGTRALLAARGASAVAVAALVNVTAAAGWALGTRGPVVIVCSGERGARSIEDDVCAGLLVDRMATAETDARLSAAAAHARAVGTRYGKDVARLRDDSSWARHLIRRGRAADVAACLALDTSTLVPIYDPDGGRVVA